MVQLNNVFIDPLLLYLPGKKPKGKWEKKLPFVFSKPHEYRLLKAVVGFPVGLLLGYGKYRNKKFVTLQC